MQADVYIPDGAQRFPAVLVVHGGGWEGRSRADMDDISAQLATQGMVAVNISHRFTPKHLFPAQLHDLQQAMHWIHAHAEQYHIDPQRIGGFGYSSGAHLIALLATVSPGDELDAPYGGPDTRLNAVVAGGIPSDLRKFEGGRLVPQFLGTTRDKNPQLFALASPVAHVTSDDPPTFLYHGGLDRRVDVSHAEDIHKALQVAGVPVELYIDHSRAHMTMFLFSGSAVEAGIAFLRRYLVDG